MKSMVLILLSLCAVSNTLANTIEYKAPSLICRNDVMSTTVYASPTENNAELSIERLQSASRFISHEIAVPHATLDGSQAFVTENNALVVFEGSVGLEGVLTQVEGDETSQQKLECIAQFQVQPIQDKSF